MTRSHLIQAAAPSAMRARSCKSRLRASTALTALAGMIALGLATTYAPSANAQSLPTGGAVTAGSAGIVTGANTLTVNQSSQNVAINWTSFSIDAGNSVVFVQPNADSVALNRVVGPDASAIYGNLSSNGQVFLVNPNGILFAPGSQVNVGGMVASTLSISDADFMAGTYAFSGAGGAVLNQGSINADGGYVALLGASVDNQGLIQANLGTVALAAGNAMTLDVAGDGLLTVAITTGAVNAMVQNGGVLRANGGQVIMTAQAAGDLLHTVINNTGLIEAHTIGSRNGTIALLADMQSGTVNAGGTLDAGAPDGGDGGVIQTAAADVNVADTAIVITAAPTGVGGVWLVASQDFVVEAGGDISGDTLSNQLVTNNIVIDTRVGGGDINVNEAVSWTASGEPTSLVLLAASDVNINAAITATNGNLAVCCGRDVNVNADITATNGSVLLNAGRNVNVFHVITTTDGNIALCAGHNVRITAAITLTRGSTIPSESLDLPVGLTIIAGADGTGPGEAGGTLLFDPLTPPVTVTVAPTTINYNPVSYGASSDFSDHFTMTEGATLTQRMLLFPTATRPFDGGTAATLSGFNTTLASGQPVGVTLVAGPDATANFDSSGVGTGIGITYSGYTLAGPNADQYALAGSCCVPTFRTTGAIEAVVSPPPPPPPPPPGPPLPPPPDTPPGVTPTIFYPTPSTPMDLELIGEGVRMPEAPVEEQPAPATPTPVYAPRQDRN